MDYSKYAKLRKARMPEQQIRDVMTDDGFLPMEINKFFHSTRKALPGFLPKPRKVVDNVLTPINPGKNEAVVQKVLEVFNFVYYYIYILYSFIYVYVVHNIRNMSRN